MRIIVKLTVSIAILAGALRGLALGVVAQTNLCALLSQADVSSVVGTPVKLADGKLENGLLGQECCGVKAAITTRPAASALDRRLSA